MVRVLVPVAAVIVGGYIFLSGSSVDTAVAWALLLPVVSVACIAMLWE